MTEAPDTYTRSRIPDARHFSTCFGWRTRSDSFVMPIAKRRSRKDAMTTQTDPHALLAGWPAPSLSIDPNLWQQAVAKATGEGLNFKQWQEQMLRKYMDG